MTELEARPLTSPEPRKGMPSPRLDEAEFKRRFRAQFHRSRLRPPRGRARQDRRRRLGRLRALAQGAAARARRARSSPIPTTISRSTGSRRATRSHAAQRAARRRSAAAAHPADQRLVAQRAHLPGRDVQVLSAGRDRARGDREPRRSRPRCSTSRGSVAEYGRNIHPCKACFSTAPALCHWPCSCYPNHSLGQTQDWMNDIYPMWVRGARHHDRHAGQLVPGRRRRSS